jgi:hypothetical protein
MLASHAFPGVEDQAARFRRRHPPDEPEIMPPAAVDLPALATLARPPRAGRGFAPARAATAVAAQQTLGNQVTLRFLQRAARPSAPAGASVRDGRAARSGAGAPLYAPVAARWHEPQSQAQPPRALRSVPGRSQVIQRSLSTSQVYGVLQSSEAVSPYLDKELRQGQKVGDHIRTVLANYESHFEGDDATVANAMKLVGAFSTVAKEIARELNAPRLRSLITRELVTSFKGEITKKLATSDEEQESNPQAAATLQLATALAGDDPIGLYLHKEKISFHEAVWRIRTMAAKASRKPSETFNLLSQQYQMEMGAYALDEIKKGQRGREQSPGGVFDFKDIYGEIPADFFESLLDLQDGKPQWSSQRGEGLRFNTEGTADKNLKSKLDELGKAVAEWDEEQSPEPSPETKAVSEGTQPPSEQGSQIGSTTAEEPGQGDKSALLEQLRNPGQLKPVDLPPPGMSPLSERQYAYLRNLAKAEATKVGDSSSPQQTARTKVLEHLRKEHGAASEEAAQEMLTTALDNLNRAPITITFKAMNLFGDASKFANDDDPSQHVYKQFFEAFSERINLGEHGVPGSEAAATRVTPNALDRGPDYGSWRREKDERAIANTGLSLYELPTFAAVRTEKTQRNLYGDFHFELKQSVRRRATYSYGTGVERRDLTLVLADAVDHGGASAKDYIGGVLQNRIIGTELEIHIYGPVNFTEDVEVIHFPPTVDISTSSAEALDVMKGVRPDDQMDALGRASQRKKDAALNLIAYAQEHGIRCEGGAFDTLTAPTVVAPQATATLPTQVQQAVAQQQGGTSGGIMASLGSIMPGFLKGWWS